MAQQMTVEQVRDAVALRVDQIRAEQAKEDDLSTIKRAAELCERAGKVELKEALLELSTKYGTT